MTALLQAHAAATLFLTGLIWFVQIVHYPLFDRVTEAFVAFEHAHASRTTWVVGPPMLLEAATAVLLVLRPPMGAPRALPWIGLVLLAVIWLSTAFLQVPRHEILARGWDEGAHHGLVATNWIRTIGWTLRGGIALWLLRAGIGSGTG